MDEIQEVEQSSTMVRGFSLSGEYVKELLDKSFSIIEMPFYKILPNMDDKDGEDKEKLCMKVKLSDGAIVEYLPNKTSQKSIINKCGFKLERWVGFKSEFFILEQKVGQNIKQVIYIKEGK